MLVLFKKLIQSGKLLGRMAMSRLFMHSLCFSDRNGIVVAKGLIGFVARNVHYGVGEEMVRGKYGRGNFLNVQLIMISNLHMT